jgi:hypothetical protein
MSIKPFIVSDLHAGEGTRTLRISPPDPKSWNVALMLTDL